MQSLNQLISIDKNFQTAVNLRLDRESNYKFLNYIPTASSTALMAQLLKNVLEEKGNSASVIIGPYGKGKSHLLLVLLSLLEQQYPEEQKEVLKKIGDVNADCEKLAGRIVEKGPYLTVLVSDNGGSLNTSFLLALKAALERKNLQNIMPDSYFGEALKMIKLWKREFPQTYAKLEEKLSAYPAFHKEKEPVLRLQAGLEEMNEEALELFRKLYPLLTAGAEFSPLINMEAVVLYREVNDKLCRQYGYRGIYVVFDEFSKYVEGHRGIGFAADMKILQDLCEMANASGTERFFLTFVTHKSLREYGSRFNREMQNLFRGVEGRLKEYLFVESVQNHFDLIRSVLRKTDGFEAEYHTLLETKGCRELVERSYALSVFHLQFFWEDYCEIVAKGCFPMTPVAAVLLLGMCEKIAQNERTLFTFLASDEPNSVYHAVQKKGRKAYLGADLIYDYFSPVLREISDNPEVHNEWLKAEYALKQTEDAGCRDIIKAIAVLQIAGNRQEMPVQAENIALALGKPMGETESGVAALVENQLLIWRSKLGCYAFRNNIGINLEEELADAVKMLPEKLDIAAQLPTVSELEFILPKSYNQDYSITRYFQYVFLTPKTLRHIVDTEYLFQERFADGKLIALITEESADEGEVREIPEKLSEDASERELPKGDGKTWEGLLKEVLEQSRLWQDSRAIVLIPKHGFSQQENIRKVLALRALLSDRDFIEENRAVEQEIKLYIEDILFEINAALEDDFLPQNGGCLAVWQGSAYEFTGEKEFNAFLSKICGTYYAFSPKVNHELLNIQNVTGQYLKARNHVVDRILSEHSEKYMADYEKGTSPEAMVYRTAFVRTGLCGTGRETDTGSRRILEEIQKFILKCAGERQCFAELYGRLQGEGYGARKGVLPLFLALEFAAVAGTPVIYLQSKEVSCNSEMLNNINDRPEQYYLYLENVDGRKEAYLADLEAFLQMEQKGLQKQQRMNSITENLQRRYRALPKAVSNWKQYEEAEWKNGILHGLCKEEQWKEVFWQEQDAALFYKFSESLKVLLRKAEVNSRELLFDKVPSLLNRKQADSACAQAIEIVFRVWQQKMSFLQEKLAGECLLLWGGKEGESLTGYLRDWYRSQSDVARSTVLGTKAAKLLSYLEDLKSFRNEEIVSELAHIISGIHMEDWTPETYHNFLEDLKAVKREVEDISSEKEDAGNRKKVVFTNAEGRLVERYFQHSESGIGDFLKNAIREALDEFGDSMETGEKVAVLVETLEEILK